MNIEYSGSYNDMRYDDWLVLVGYKTSHKFLRIRYFFIALGILLLISIAISLFFEASELVTLFCFLSVVSFLIAGILTLLNAVQRKKKISIKEKATGQISEAGNTMVIKDVKITIQWDGYKGYRLRENLLLLVTKDGAQLIPKNFFSSDEDWNTAISIVTSRLQEIEPMKPGWGTWLLIIFFMLVSAVTVIFSLLKN